MHALSIIPPPRYQSVPLWRTYGRYRKQMKRGYSRTLYNQRNKNETIMSVIKRLFGECLISRLTRTQNRELSFRCIAYNMHRLTNLVIITMISTEPQQAYEPSIEYRLRLVERPRVPDNPNEDEVDYDIPRDSTGFLFEHI